MKLLLDTHIALQAISDSKRLSEDVRALLEDEDQRSLLQHGVSVGSSDQKKNGSALILMDVV